MERIVVDPEICSGKPTIRGTRIMVKNIPGMFAGGYDMARVLKEYPTLTAEDVCSAVEYGQSGKRLEAFPPNAGSDVW